MKFTDIGYRGQFLHIPPQHQLNSEAELLLLGTSYGSPNAINEIFEEWEREYLSSSQDLDITSPFPKLTCLDGMANRIYTTLLHLNDFIYTQFNKDDYSEGFEFLVLQKYHSRIYWAQVGWPQVILSSGKNLIPLDSNYGFRPKSTHAAPNIPSHLLGVERSVNFRLESINVKEHENIFFIKSSSIPQSFYEGIDTSSDEDLIKKLYEHAPKQGAWVGRLSFKDSFKI